MNIPITQLSRFHKLSILTPLIGVILFAIPTEANAVSRPFDLRQTAKLNAATQVESGLFGHAVDLWGDTAIVGAPREDPDLGQGPVEDAGAAYVNIKTPGGWTQQAMLTASDGAPGDIFGGSVAIYEDTIVIGATSNGAVYVFNRTGGTWSESQLITNPDAGSSEQFGKWVAIYGHYMVIGADFEDPDLGSGPIGNAGAAYVYTDLGGSWQQQDKLVAPDASPDDHFGNAVTIYGNTIAVGAPDADPDHGSGPLDAAGSVYVFTRSGSDWIFQTRLIPSDPQASGQFGNRLDIWRNVIVAGAPFASPDLGNGLGESSGVVYIFSRNSGIWNQLSRLAAIPGVFGFGRAIAIHESSIVVGAAGSSVDLGDGEMPSAGLAFVYYLRGDSIKYLARLNAKDAQEGDLFGYSVGVWGPAIVLGARAEDPYLGTEELIDAGSAYIFEFVPNQ